MVPVDAMETGELCTRNIKRLSLWLNQVILKGMSTMIGTTRMDGEQPDSTQPTH